MAIIGVAATALTGTLKIGDALSGFGNNTVWLIGVAFFVSRAIIKTGLGARIALHFMKRFGKKTLGLSYGLGLADLVLAPAMPSNTARAGAGIYFHLTGNPQLIDSQIYSNSSTYNGAGVHLASGYYDVILSGNAIHHKDPTNGGGGGGLYVMGTNAPWLYNNRIYSNTATS